MDSVEDYAGQWARHEEVEPDTLSEWVKSIRSLIKQFIGGFENTYVHSNYQNVQ